MDKTRSLSLIAVALLATLAACKQASSPQDSASNAPSAMSSEAGAGISARDGKLVLSPVSGRPGAAYFTVRNDGSAPIALTGVEVGGAGKAQMHETSGGSMKAVDSLPIAPGAELEFAPGGFHVMVFDISPVLKPGQTTDITLAFSTGEKLKMPVMIDSMGSSDDDMDGMGPMPPATGAAPASDANHGHSGGMANMPGMTH
ncbi:copper chaperone PCu(A)C [Novosphingobium sp. BL-8H]|uniref:copper chaperone PCu(A)C n=1 Tax=Novosphingobium sp. BL-8H TaxID=3127640 RepID=UPI0037566A1F